MIDILLPTYNGEKYVREQIDSILHQSAADWRLIIRDDGSTDTTPQIIKEYAETYPDRILCVYDEKGNLGVTNGVFELLRYVKADYVMLCDQDDVWFPNKVARLEKCICMKEKEYPESPILVHSEGILTDEKLRAIGRNSLVSYQEGRDKHRTSFAPLLLCNSVQGASMIFNRELLKILLEFLPESVNRKILHDSIIASVASINGKIFFYHKPLMYYRKHGSNQTDVKKRYLVLWPIYTPEERKDYCSIKFLIVNRRKCMLLRKNFSASLSSWQKRVLDHYIHRPNDWKEFKRLGLDQEFGIRDLLRMRIFGVE